VGAGDVRDPRRSLGRISQACCRTWLRLGGVGVILVGEVGGFVMEETPIKT
jgi:hypothetical protein